MEKKHLFSKKIFMIKKSLGNIMMQSIQHGILNSKIHEYLYETQKTFS